jgi:hypothetical protein
VAGLHVRLDLHGFFSLHLYRRKTESKSIIKTKNVARYSIKPLNKYTRTQTGYNAASRTHDSEEEDMNPMQTHVKVLAILHIVFGALGVLGGILVFAVMGGVASMVHFDRDPDAAAAIPLLGGIGAIVMVFLFLASIPGIVGGVGLLSYRPWARILIIVLSVLELIRRFLGTAYQRGSAVV